MQNTTMTYNSQWNSVLSVKHPYYWLPSLKVANIQNSKLSCSSVKYVLLFQTVGNDFVELSKNLRVHKYCLKCAGCAKPAEDELPMLLGPRYMLAITVEWQAHPCPTMDLGIKSVSWEYSCEREYFIKFHKGGYMKCSSLLAVLPRNWLDPDMVGFLWEEVGYL